MKLPPLTLEVVNMRGDVVRTFTVPDPREEIARMFNRLNRGRYKAQLRQCLSCDGLPVYRGVCAACLDELLRAVSTGYATLDALERLGFLDGRQCKTCDAPAEVGSLCKKCCGEIVGELLRAERD